MRRGSFSAPGSVFLLDEALGLQISDVPLGFLCIAVVLKFNEVFGSNGAELADFSHRVNLGLAQIVGAVAILVLLSGVGFPAVFALNSVARVRMFPSTRPTASDAR